MPESTSFDSELLSNMITCLDRLYDEKTGVEDVRALLVATAAALTDSPLSRCMADSANRLALILASGGDATDQNRAALGATNEVRRMVASLL
jgi:hypothetical protein